MIPIDFVLLLAAVLFTIGAIGVLVRRNALIIFMCIEMMLNSVNLTLVALANQWGNMTGQVFAFIVMAVAAVEVAVGLAIIMAIVRHKDTTNVDEINLLKG
ncbi:MAG: NADH-quinone oxidoreductase subunit NuoK [Chloroflexi bacterium]|nr:NADH-quinone oxidoreductase subunit NuoK [Chloroflexota bacterium]